MHPADFHTVAEIISKDDNLLISKLTTKQATEISNSQLQKRIVDALHVWAKSSSEGRGINELNKILLESDLVTAMSKKKSNCLLFTLLIS